MKKIMILLSLLMFLPLTAISKPLIPIMKTLFTDVTGTVPDAEEIAHKAELFRQQTGVAPFIVVLPGVNEASFRQNGKAMLVHAASSMSNVKGSVLLLFTTREPRLIMITNGQVESGLVVTCFSTSFTGISVNTIAIAKLIHNNSRASFFWKSPRRRHRSRSESTCIAS